MRRVYPAHNEDRTIQFGMIIPKDVVATRDSLDGSVRMPAFPTWLFMNVDRRRLRICAGSGRCPTKVSVRQTSR